MYNKTDTSARSIPDNRYNYVFQWQTHTLYSTNCHCPTTYSLNNNTTLAYVCTTGREPLVQTAAAVGNLRPAFTPAQLLTFCNYTARYQFLLISHVTRFCWIYNGPATISPETQNCWESWKVTAPTLCCKQTLCQNHIYCWSNSDIDLWT